MSNCSYQGCIAKARTKGLCHKHYNAGWRQANVERVREAQRNAYTPLAVRDMNLRHIYGITLAEFDLLAASQGGVCEICKRAPRDKKGRLQVDHKHTGKKCQLQDIRGLLCLHCNVMIGKAEDSVERLKSAIAYLEKYDNV